MYLCPRLDTLGSAPVWLLAIQLLASLTVKKTLFVAALPGFCGGVVVASLVAFSRSFCWVVCRGLPRLDVFVVERVPLGAWRRCPASVASSTLILLLIASAVKPGHPWRYPALAAAINVNFGWEPRLA